MNPVHHHLNTMNQPMFGQPAYNTQQVSMQDTPCHVRHSYLSQTLYMPGNSVPIVFQPNVQADAITAQIKQWQDQNAPRGQYLMVPMGAIPLNVLFFGVHAHTGLAIIMLVDPTYDGHSSMVRALMPESKLSEVPAHLLPGVRQNCTLAVLVQQGGVPLNNAQRNLQMQGMLPQSNNPFAGAAMVPPANGFSMQQLTPQAAPQEPVQLYARSFDELLTMPNGALFDDGTHVWRRMARASEGYVLHCTTAEFKNPPAPVAPPAPIKLAQPAPNVIEVVKEIPVPKRTALSATTHGAEERGYLTEREHVDMYGGNPNPNVAIDSETRKPIQLLTLLSIEKYLKDASTFTWTATFNSAEWIRWRKQYNAASCDWYDGVSTDTGARLVRPAKAPEGSTIDIDSMLQAIQARQVRSAREPDPVVESLDDPLDDFSITSDTGITSAEPEVVVKENDAEIITLENIFDHRGPKPTTMVMPGVRRGWRIQVKETKNGVKRLDKVEDAKCGRITTPFTGSIFADAEPTLAQLQATEKFCKDSAEYQEPIPGAPLISVEPVFTNKVGQTVTSDELMSRFQEDPDYEALRDMAADSGLETTLIFNIEPSVRQEGFINIVNSVQEAAAQLETSDISAIPTGDSGEAELYPAAYCAYYHVVEVVGGPQLARVATYLASELQEKITDVHDFNEWFDNVGSGPAGTPLHIEMCGTLTSKESKNLHNYAGMCQFNTLLTKRVNQALREQLGLDLTIVNYQQQYRELRQRIHADYDIGGLAAVWTKLENDVIMSVIEDIKTSKAYAEENEQFVDWNRMGDIEHVLQVRKSVIVKVAATLDDIDVQLSEFGLARSAPEDRSEILASLLRALSSMTEAYEVSFMDAPTQLIDIYLHLLDGVTLKLYRHPSHTTDSSDRVIWMITQV